MYLDPGSSITPKAWDFAYERGCIRSLNQITWEDPSQRFPNGNITNGDHFYRWQSVSPNYLRLEWTAVVVFGGTWYYFDSLGSCYNNYSWSVYGASGGRDTNYDFLLDGSGNQIECYVSHQWYLSDTIFRAFDQAENPFLNIDKKGLVAIDYLNYFDGTYAMGLPFILGQNNIVYEKITSPIYRETHVTYTYDSINYPVAARVKVQDTSGVIADYVLHFEYTN